MKKWWIIKAIVCVMATIVGVGFLVMFLWNNLVPNIFHLPPINFWQAAGLLILARILVGGFKVGCGACGGARGGGMWKRHWESKMADMTPEQKEEFRQKMYNKCGPWFKEK